LLLIALTNRTVL